MKSWLTQSSHPCCGSWTSITDSTFMMQTNGGDLMITMDISLNGGSHGTCQPIIDGQWAGSYGNLPKTNDVYWKEGLQAVGCCGGGWRKWTASRIYPGVPAGMHNFTVQCATDSGTMSAGEPSASSSWSVVELP
jgi:hypothetical protein